MRLLVKNLLTPKANPIGVDFGSDCLRLAQVRNENGQLQMLAVAAVNVPEPARADMNTRLDFFVHAMRDLLNSGKFVGRRVVLGLPAASTFIQHIRLPKMDEPAMTEVLPDEIRGKMPIDPGHAMLRHIVAGEVFVEQEPKNEVIVLATRRDFIERFLGSAHKARLDVVGMNVELKAIVDCFSRIYRRKNDSTTTNCIVDIGYSATRAMITQGTQILFARSIPIGSSQFNKDVAAALKISQQEARQIRLQSLAESPKALVPQLVGAATESAPAPGLSSEHHEAIPDTEDRRKDLRDDQPDLADEQIDAEHACAKSVERLVEELTFCRRYHEATFPSVPIQRLIFIGAEAANRVLCQQIAREMALPAQIGDPLVRLVQGREIFAQAGLDVTQPQPAWPVAIGLSAGAAGEVS